MPVKKPVSRPARAAPRRRKAVAATRRHPYDPRTMTNLDRYILRQSFSIMVFITAALSAAVWLAQSLRLVDLIVNRGLSPELFLYLALLILPRFLDIVLPIGAFIAVLFVFNRLTSESELVVMRGAGIGPFALARPVFILAVISFRYRTGRSRICSLKFVIASSRHCCRRALSRQYRAS
jgi:hypothetical protein